MTKIYKKKILISAIVVFVVIVAGLIGTGSYMLNYSLDYPKAERMTAKHWKQRMVKECPWVKGMDGFRISEQAGEGHIPRHAFGLSCPCHLPLCAEKD